MIDYAKMVDTMVARAIKVDDSDRDGVEAKEFALHSAYKAAELVASALTDAARNARELAYFAEDYASEFESLTFAAEADSINEAAEAMEAKAQTLYEVWAQYADQM